MTRNLIATTATHRTYEILDNEGRKVGRDEELIPTLEQTNEVTLRDRLKALLSEPELLDGAPAATVIRAIQKVQRNQKRLSRMVLRELDSAE